MGTEIERKWVLKDLGAFALQYLYAIRQGYLRGDLLNLRVREATSINGRSVYYLTSKQGHGVVRQEIETLVTDEMGLHLLEAATWTLRKTRYAIPQLKQFSEAVVDAFHDDLEGLVLLEVEFCTEEDAAAFQLSKRLEEAVVEEVTHDPRYENVNLAKSGVVPYGAPE
jgi:adenylate cyclase